MIVPTRSAAAVGCLLVALGASGCSGDQRSVPSMVVAWPQEPTSTSEPATGAAASGTDGDAGDPGADASAPVDLEALDAARTDTVEDAGALRALLDAVGLDDLGEYSVSVDPGASPVVLEIGWDEPAPSAARWPDTVEERGVLLLATIADLDEIRFHLEGGTGTDGHVDRASADRLLEEPVDELGATTEGLREILDRVDP
ncbi:hypothetical protein [Georgenia sp. Z1491]|uniref:hypothetical protein n=1 Tax=Georgenia sp. Z1491 TaxID=3416707 RepID=UPI003CF79D26